MANRKFIQEIYYAPTSNTFQPASKILSETNCSHKNTTTQGQPKKNISNNKKNAFHQIFQWTFCLTQPLKRAH